MMGSFIIVNELSIALETLLGSRFIYPVFELQ